MITGVIRAGLILTIFAAAACSSAGSVWRGKVVSVVDGTNLYVNRGTEVLLIRIHGVKAPAPGRPGGLDARRFSVVTTLGRHVQVREVGWDRKDRLLAAVSLEGGRDLGMSLLRAGLAWHRSAGAPSLRLARVEAQAARERRGIWALGRSAR